MTRPALALALVSCVGAAILLRLPWLDAVADRDVTVYATIGEHLGWRTLPYSQLFDHKQPLVYPFYAVFDALWPADMTALRAIGAVLAGLSAFLVLAVLAPMAGRVRAAIAAALALVAGASTFVAGGDLNVEHLALPFTTAAVLVPIALRDRPGDLVPFACGVLAALPALMKVSLLAPAAAGVVALLLARDRAAVRTLVLYAAGVLAPAALAVLFFAVRGALGDFWDANVTFNRRYVDIVEGGDRWDRFAEHSEVWWLVGAAALAGLLRLATVAPGAQRRGWRGDAVAWALLASLAGGAVAVLSPGPAFLHYLVPLIVPAACLVALAPRIAVTVVLALVAAWPFVRDDARNFDRGADGISERMYGAEIVARWELHEPIADVLRAGAQPGDRLYVTENEPGVYWESRVRPASRVLYEDSFRGLPELRDEVARGLCRFPPRFVVLSFAGWPPHLQCLAERGDYRELRRTGTFVVLERPRDAPAELEPAGG